MSTQNDGILDMTELEVGQDRPLSHELDPPNNLPHGQDTHWPMMASNVLAAPTTHVAKMGLRKAGSRVESPPVYKSRPDLALIMCTVMSKRFTRQTRLTLKTAARVN